MSTTTEIRGTTFTTPSDREIAMTRTFDAPRELVWEAFTNPEHIPHWFGYRDWTLPVCDVDLRPGGRWRYVMRGPDGQEVGLGGEYREVVRPELLVSTESFDDYPGDSVNTLTLVEEGGRTTLRCVSVYDSEETRDGVLASGMQDGAAVTYERLAEVVSGLAAEAG